MKIKDKLLLFNANFWNWCDEHPIIASFLPIFHLYWNPIYTSIDFPDISPENNPDEFFIDNQGVHRYKKGKFIRHYHEIRFNLWRYWYSKYFYIDEDIIKKYINYQYKICSEYKEFKLSNLKHPERIPKDQLDSIKTFSDYAKVSSTWTDECKYTSSEQYQKCYDYIFRYLVLHERIFSYEDVTRYFHSLDGNYGFMSENFNIYKKLNYRKYKIIFYLWITGRFHLHEVLKDFFKYGLIFKNPYEKCSDTIRKTDKSYTYYILNLSRSTMSILPDEVSDALKDFRLLSVNAKPSTVFERNVRWEYRKQDPFYLLNKVDPDFSELEQDKEWTFDNIILPFIGSLRNDVDWNVYAQKLLNYIK